MMPMNPKYTAIEPMADHCILNNDKVNKSRVHSSTLKTSNNVTNHIHRSGNLTIFKNNTENKFSVLEILYELTIFS